MARNSLSTDLCVAEHVTAPRNLLLAHFLGAIFRKQVIGTHSTAICPEESCVAISKAAAIHLRILLQLSALKSRSEAASGEPKSRRYPDWCASLKRWRRVGQLSRRAHGAPDCGNWDWMQFPLGAFEIRIPGLKILVIDLFEAAKAAFDCNTAVALL